MSDATIKHIYICLLAAFCLLGQAACGSKQSDEDRNAESLMTQIKSLYTGKKYDEAMLMIDSLMKSYPGLIDVQHQAMHIQTMITEKKALADSILNERLLERSMALADSLKQNLKLIKNADLVEGYLVHKSMPSDGVPQTTGLVARATTNGDISLMSSLRGSRARHTKLTATADTATVETMEVPLSNPRNYKFNDNGQNVELVTFNSHECLGFCAFVAKHIEQPITVTFSGKSKCQKKRLSQSEKEAIACVYEYANAVTAANGYATSRIKLARKLQLARKQIKQTATNIQGGR